MDRAHGVQGEVRVAREAVRHDGVVVNPHPPCSFPTFGRQKMQRNRWKMQWKMSHRVSYIRNAVENGRESHWKMERGNVQMRTVAGALSHVFPSFLVKLDENKGANSTFSINQRAPDPNSFREHTRGISIERHKKPEKEREKRAPRRFP